MPAAGAGRSIATSAARPARAVVCAGPGEELGDGHLARAARRTSVDRGAEAEERAARLHRRRGVHHVAADRALAHGSRASRRSPTRPRAPVNRSRTTGCATMLRVRHERAEAQAAVPAAVDAAQRVDPVDRDERSRQRRLALAGADDEIGAARDGPGAGGQRRDGLLDGRRGEVSTLTSPPPGSRPRPAPASSAAAARASPIDLRDRVRDRARRRDARGLADALRALRPGVRRVDLDPGDVDLRRVRGGHELVVEQVRVPLAASSSSWVPSVSAWPMPITTPP